MRVESAPCYTGLRKGREGEWALLLYYEMTVWTLLTYTTHISSQPKREREWRKGTKNVQQCKYM